MNNEMKNSVLSKTYIFIEWIHHDIWNKTYPYAINLVKHAILFSITILILKFMIELTGLLFPNIPFIVKILIYISELIIIIHFAKENIFKDS